MRTIASLDCWTMSFSVSPVRGVVVFVGVPQDAAARRGRRREPRMG